jgi:hypothetical protein
MLVHTYYCYSHLGTKQYLKFRFTFKLPLNSINTSNLGNTFQPKFNSHLNIDRTSVYVSPNVWTLHFLYGIFPFMAAKFSICFGLFFRLWM